MDPHRQQSALAGRRSVAISKLFRRFGNCRFPWLLTPKAPIGVFEMRAVFRVGRIDSNCWCSVPGSLEAQDREPDCIAPWDLVARNTDRARRRRLRECMFPRLEPVGPVTSSDGAVVAVPSDDGVAPNVCPPIPKSRAHFSLLNSESDGEMTKDSGATSAYPTTPKRAGDDPSAPPSQRRCTASEAARREGDGRFHVHPGIRN